MSDLKKAENRFIRASNSLMKHLAEYAESLRKTKLLGQWLIKKK